VPPQIAGEAQLSFLVLPIISDGLFVHPFLPALNLRPAFNPRLALNLRA
jgi:hypothetical protein